MRCYKCFNTVPDKSPKCPSCGQDFTGKSSKAPDHGAELKDGDKIGHYEVRELVGEGPMGRVYKVLDTQFEVITALKILHPEFARDRSVRNTLKDVYRSLTEFDSEGFVKIFDAGEAQGKTFIAMDYLEGLSLRRLIEVRAGAGGRFEWEETEPIIESVCHALESMRPGEVYGDIKPENVIILPDSVRLTDLGLSRVLDPGKFVEVEVRGGNNYMAPELAENAERILSDPAVDVYAIGVLLYQLLTGRLPGEGERSPGAVVNTIPGAVSALVERALEPDPDKRFAHVAELHLEISRLAKKPEVAAQVEIFLHDLPARPQFAKPEPEPPPPAPSPAKEPVVEPPPAPRQAKSLFDDELLGAAEKRTAKVGAAAAPPSAPAKSKAPLFAAIGVLVAGLAAGGAFFTMRGGAPTEPAKEAKPEVAAAERQAPAPAVPEVSEAQASAALEKAEKVRAEAFAVDVPKTAPETFLAAMKLLREATDFATAKDYASAVSLAVAAERSFSDAIIKGMSAQAAGKAAAKEKVEKRKSEVSAALPAAKRPTCADGMAHVAAGAFVMGAPAKDPDRNPGERYDERISVPGFCIDLYEYPNRRGAKPTAGASWMQAKQACEAQGKRLCREEEWEKACKGPSNHKFPYGASFNANSCSTEDANGDDRTLAASGRFNACVSGYGVYDMSGNLWEWTSSRLQPNIQDMVLRGGSYTRPDYHDRCANRYNSSPSVRDQEFGFRCCADPNQ